MKVWPLLRACFKCLVLPWRGLHRILAGPQSPTKPPIDPYRAADEALYAVDPALAVELGYEPPAEHTDKEMWEMAITQQEIAILQGRTLSMDQAMLEVEKRVQAEEELLQSTPANKQYTQYKATLQLLAVGTPPPVRH